MNFGRLNIGLHEFSYSIDSKFFDDFGATKIEHCKTNTQLQIEKKQANLMVFNFDIKGEASFACDRCTDPLIYPMESEFKVLVKVEDQENDTSDEIVYLPPDSYEYNVASLIYDFHILSVPFKKDCLRKDHENCLKINEILDFGSVTEESAVEDDPRWNELRKLL